MVASKCSQNHLISETHRTVQSFKQHFLHNSPLVQLHTSASLCKGVRNILEAILLKPFQLYRRISNEVSSITIVPSLEC
jgi:hypothetical protein